MGIHETSESPAILTGVGPTWPTQSKREALFAIHGYLCNTALELMKKKNADYGANDDPYRNFRTFGLLGVLVRMSDKLARLHSFIENGTLAVKEESVQDTILDIINYAVLFDGCMKDGMK